MLRCTNDLLAADARVNPGSVHLLGIAQGFCLLPRNAAARRCGGRC